MTIFESENKSLRSEVDIEDIWDIVACKMFCTKFLKLEGTNKFLPTAWELIKILILLKMKVTYWGQASTSHKSSLHFEA